MTTLPLTSSVAADVRPIQARQQAGWMPRPRDGWMRSRPFAGDLYDWYLRPEMAGQISPPLSRTVLVETEAASVPAITIG